MSWYKRIKLKFCCWSSCSMNEEKEKEKEN